jgi:hypothetical protein
VRSQTIVKAHLLKRRVIPRCEDVPLLGLFAPHVYQDPVGVDADERGHKRIRTYRRMMQLVSFLSTCDTTALDYATRSGGTVLSATIP